jgi:1,2-diacylglycerol 3-alpha-glucosyltransferase
VRIAVVADSAPPTPSGVANGVAVLGRGLAARGHEVVHVGPRWPGTAEGWNADPDGPTGPRTGPRPSVVALPSVSVRPSIGLRLAPATAAELTSRLRHHDLDVVHVHTEGPLGWAVRGAARRLDVPVVATLHTFYDHYLHYAGVPRPMRPVASALVRAALARFLRGADHLVAPSPAAATLAAALAPGATITVVPNPAPPGPVLPDSSPWHRGGDPLLLSVGRIAEEKRARQLVEVLASALTARPDVRAMVIGGGPELRTLRRRVARWGLADRLLLPGPLPHAAVLRWYRAASVYVSAARSENHPLTLLEAAAAGLPLVVADEPRLLSAGLAGVAETGRDEREVVAAALALLDDDRRWADRARAARGYAARHGLSAHLDGMEAVYRRVRTEVAVT